MSVETNVRQLRAAAVCGIVIQLAGFSWILARDEALPPVVAIGLSVALGAVAAALVYVAARGSEGRGFYTAVILSSAIVWSLLWGLIGFTISEIMLWSVMQIAGFVFGAEAGAVFGSLVVLGGRAERISLPELAVFGTVAGVLPAVAGLLMGLADNGTAEGWGPAVAIFAVLGGGTGLACRWVVSRAARYRLTPST